MALARVCSDAGSAIAKIKRACEEWNAALADGTYTTRSKRRKQCVDLGILCDREMERDSEIAARTVRSTLAQRLHAWRLVAAVSSGKEGKPVEEDDTAGKKTAVGSSIAKDGCGHGTSHPAPQTRGPNGGR